MYCLFMLINYANQVLMAETRFAVYHISFSPPGSNSRISVMFSQ